MRTGGIKGVCRKECRTNGLCKHCLFLFVFLHTVKPLWKQNRFTINAHKACRDPVLFIFTDGSPLYLDKMKSPFKSLPTKSKRYKTFCHSHFCTLILHSLLFTTAHILYQTNKAVCCILQVIITLGAENSQWYGTLKRIIIILSSDWSLCCPFSASSHWAQRGLYTDYQSRQSGAHQEEKAHCTAHHNLK